jgi:hypothetical protein
LDKNFCAGTKAIYSGGGSGVRRVGQNFLSHNCYFSLLTSSEREKRPKLCTPQILKGAQQAERVFVQQYKTSPEKKTAERFTHSRRASLSQLQLSILQNKLLLYCVFNYLICAAAEFLFYCRRCGGDSQTLAHKSTCKARRSQVAFAN